MFKLMSKEINAILGAQTILIWTLHVDSDEPVQPPFSLETPDGVPSVA